MNSLYSIGVNSCFGDEQILATATKIGSTQNRSRAIVLLKYIYSYVNMGRELVRKLGSIKWLPVSAARIDKHTPLLPPSLKLCDVASARELSLENPWMVSASLHCLEPCVDFTTPAGNQVRFGLT